MSVSAQIPDGSMWWKADKRRTAGVRTLRVCMTDGTWAYVQDMLTGRRFRVSMKSFGGNWKRTGS